MRILPAMLLTAGMALAQSSVFSGSRDHPAIAYATHPVHDPVARLNAKLRDGSVQLKFDGASGYLRSVLDALDIPVESQMAVFAKNSLQAPIISPQNPRTIFFNDSAAAGWVRGERFVEVAAHDPEQGMIFYVLPQSPTDRPQFLRSDGPCLSCHEAYATLGVPGTLLRSVFPASSGLPVRTLGDFSTDHTTPFAHRWGGWYVTGKTGSLAHMGNSIFNDPDDETKRAAIPVKIDPSAYLSSSSDVVALMVFEHQMRMINLMTRFGWEIRLAAHDKTPFDLAGAAKELVDYMLFVGEPPLSGKIAGTSGFAEKFSARGPHDRHSRSLYQLDLEKRLMRYPCSYMIYSEAFDALPADGKSAIYKRMWQVLSGAHADAIIEILRDTKPEAAAYFR